jgi:hypothetical protein
MASIKKPVTLAGIIRGQGRVAACTLSAQKVTLPGTDVFAYSRFLVEDVSQALPDGDYELSVNGQSVAMRRQGGHWLSA